jgi:molybdate transport system substrate-binding protein
MVAVLLVALAGCGGGDRAPRLAGALRLFASTSLTEAFTSMKRGFETAYPALRIEVTFAPDSELAQRTAAGPAPDVLAVEGPAPLAAAGPMGPPAHFARNQLVLAVPPTNPKGVLRLADLNRPDIRVALCAETEPCGTVTAAVLTAAAVPPPATATRVSDVRSALKALTDGTVDAALVYRSDARLAGDAVATLEFPESRAALADYQAAIPTSAANPQAAAAFLAYLTSPTTTDAFTNSGYQPPS